MLAEAKKNIFEDGLNWRQYIIGMSSEKIVIEILVSNEVGEFMLVE